MDLWTLGRRTWWPALLLWAVAIPCPGAAQELGRAHNLVFGAERLAGFHVGQRSVDVGTVEVETDFSGAALLWDRSVSPLHRPRLTLDYFLTEGVTLGGGIGFFSQDVEQGSADEDYSGAILLLRGGYALRLSRSIFFWPRGGLLYYDVSLDFLGDDDLSLLALELEGVFSFAPAEGWAFTVGPSVDLGLAGELADNDMTEYSFGIVAGMIGWLEL